MALNETKGVSAEPEALSCQRTEVNQILVVQTSACRRFREKTDHKAERGTSQSCLKLLCSTKLTNKETKGSILKSKQWCEIILIYTQITSKLSSSVILQTD